MAGKPLIGGTAYDITGGKTLVGGTAYSISGGKALVGGTAYDISFKRYDPVFANNSWSDIIEACETDRVPDTWAVGNDKTMEIGGYSYQIDIIGKYHDVYAAGNRTAPLTLQLHNLFKTKYSYGVADDFWSGSDIRTTLSQELKSLMPQEVRSGIKYVSKESYSGTVLGSTADGLFLLSEYEIFGEVDRARGQEGNQYEYYILYPVNSEKYIPGGSNAEYWWERSMTRDGLQACRVDRSGGPDSYYPQTEHGISFAFCF